MIPEAETITNEDSFTGIISEDEDIEKRIALARSKIKNISQKKEDSETEKTVYERRFNRILFVVTNVSASYGKGLNPHLGVAMLMAYLDKNEFETCVIDMQLGYNEEDVAKKAKEFNADLIGLTMFSFDFINTYKSIDKIKGLTGLPIALGGAHISTVKEEALEKTKADFCITRDGEIPLSKLCLGYPLEEINSLIFRKGNEIIKNPIMKLNWELDDLPFPAYEKFEMEKYIHFIDKRIPLETSRGCPYSCTYCDVKVSMGQAFRPRSAEHIFEEFKYWYDKGFRFFEFVDDVFTMDINRSKKVCQMILDSDMKFRWNCANGIRADRIDRELLTMMKDAGCEFVAYGLETGNEEMLKIIKKAITLETATAGFELTKEVGLQFAVNFIVGHQEETYERAMDSIKYAKSIPASYVNFSNMVPYPGTDVYKWIVEKEKEGRARFIIPKEEFLKNSTTKLGLPVFETREFRYAERVKALDMGRALAKKMHLRYRMGPVVGGAVYQMSRNNVTYNALRRFATGSHFGKRLYNKFRIQY